MEILEPMGIEEIPTHGYGTGRPSPHEPLFQDVLRLNGQTLPVKCESSDAALGFARVCRAKYGRAKALGLHASQRGDTVFLYYRSDGKEA